jgi:hypothetical protein
MVIEYTKIWDFWYENKSSGNPGCDLEGSCLTESSNLLRLNSYPLKGFVLK